MSVASAPTLSQLVETVVELVPPAERVVGPAGERGCLQHRERGAERLLSHAAHRGGDRALGADDRRGRGQELGDVAGGLAEACAARREVEADDARAGAVDQHVAGVELAVGDTRGVQRAQLAPHGVEQLVGHRVGVEVVELGARYLLDDQERERAAGARDHDPRRVDARVARQQRQVRLVLHLGAPGRDQRRWRVAVREVAPGPREQLRVGFVAPEGDDPDAVVGSVGDEHRAPDGLFRGQAHAGGVDPQLCERLLDLADRRATDRGAERALHRVGDPPPEHDGGDQVGGEPARQVQAREREEPDESLAEDGGSGAPDAATPPAPSPPRPRPAPSGSGARR